MKRPTAIADASVGVDLTTATTKLHALRRGIPAYYQATVADDDDIVRVGAVAALLDLGALRADQFDLGVAMSSYGAIRLRAARFFVHAFEYDRAKQVRDARVADDAPLIDALIDAEIADDHRRLVELHRDLFLLDGNPDHLALAARSAEAFGGWRAALPWAIRRLLVRPADPHAIFGVLSTLDSAQQFETLADICAALERSQLFPVETAIFSAKAMTGLGRHKQAIARLAPLDGKISDIRLAQHAAHARAEALAAVGDFRQAHLWYERKTAVGRVVINPSGFTDAISQRASYRLPPTGTDENAATHLMMVGFPRSGTTLLEHMLAAHPEVETFEIPALRAAMALVDREAAAGRLTAATLPDARDRYYREIARRARKPGATRFVDKLPLNAAHVGLIRQLLPGKRFIFSIRHPYDVVLSCFRQMFDPNPAMENFRTLEGACRLYDFVMRQWFAEFPLQDSEQVRYVRYERLVQDFRATFGEVLDFVGVGWNDEVARFADKAGSASRQYSELRQSQFRPVDRCSVDVEGLPVPVRRQGNCATPSLGGALRIRPHARSAKRPGLAATRKMLGSAIARALRYSLVRGSARFRAEREAAERIPAAAARKKRGRPARGRPPSIRP